MSTHFSLSGKTIFVTGASSGLGAATAVECAKAGATIFANGRDRARLESVVSALDGGGHRTFVADLMEAEQNAAMIADLGKIDGIVHAAGVSRLALTKWMTDDFYDEIMAINNRVPLFLTRDILKANKLRKGGAIVFLSSIASILSTPGLGVYSNAKAGLEVAARVMARELLKSKIRVNSVLPASIETPMLLEHPELSAEALEIERQKYPWGFGKPEDVACACIYFLSDASKWVTGTRLIVDGGVTL